MKPRTATGRKVVAIYGIALLDDVKGIETEAATLDPLRLGMAMDLVDEEDERVGVVGRGSKTERIIAEYYRLSRS